MTPTPTHGGAQQTVPPVRRTPIHTPKVVQSKAIRIGAAIFLIILLYFAGSTAWHNNKKAKSQIIKTAENNQSEAVSMIREVTFDSQYGKVVHIPDGFSFSFFGATVPYCAANKDQHIVKYGDVDEDVCKDYAFGKENPDNREFTFKSQNGKPGTIKILLVCNFKP